jgi:hypothetical protein
MFPLLGTAAMKNEIVRKLNQHLASEITKEADVVYVMAEIRKLFEHVRTARNYPVLAFYANWILHTKIDREPWARAGLKMRLRGIERVPW